jgi:arsenate reductase-like glutaredoxin family protein
MIQRRQSVSLRSVALNQYIADEDKLEKILENPQVIKTPIVRNEKQSTIGYQPDVWKVEDEVKQFAMEY